MEEVGIRILKNNLSKYLKLVKSGEIIYIKDRNEIIAEIRRPSLLDGRNKILENFVKELFSNGDIIKAETDGLSKEAVKFIKNSEIPKEKLSWQKIYEETKQERY